MCNKHFQNDNSCRVFWIHIIMIKNKDKRGQDYDIIELLDEKIKDILTIEVQKLKAKRYCKRKYQINTITNTLNE